MANKIQPLPKSKIVDFGDAEMKNIWIKKETNKALDTGDSRNVLLQNISKVKEGTLCLMTEKLTDQKIIQALFNAAASGIRVYLLTNSYEQEMDVLKGLCLIRFGINNMGTILLSNSHSNAMNGILFSGQLTEQGLANSQHITITLDAEQIKILFRHFTYHFWNSAEKEMKEPKSNAADVGSSPIDIFPCKDNFCDPHYIKSKLEKFSKDSIILTSAVSKTAHFGFDEMKNTELITSLTGNNMDKIKGLADSNKIMAASGGNSLNIFYNDHECWIIPKSIIKESDILLALKTNEKQKKIIKKTIQKIKDGYADWEFTGRIKRSRLAGKKILNAGDDMKNEFIVMNEQESRIGEVYIDSLIPFNKFNQFEPDFNDNGKSVKVKFEWINVPFYLPEQSSKHVLYEKWESEQKKIIGRIETILQAIQKSEENESKLSSSLKRFFLGKKTLFQEIKSELSRFLNIQFSRISSEELKKIVTRINEIQNDVEKEISSIVKEDRKAKIDEEITELRSRIPMKENEKHRLENELESKVAEREKQLSDFCSKYGINKDNLGKQRNEWEQLSGYKNKQKNPKEAEEAELKLNELKNIQGFDFLSKLKNDIANFDKEIKRLQDEIKRKETQKARDSETSEEKSSSLEELVTGKANKDKKQDSNSLNVPNLPSLPEVGTLFQKSAQDYLAIAYWEEFELGVNEAKRLNAKLCAIKN